MSFVQALTLGIVQGLSEFLPISSDGHLTLIPFIVGWDTPGLAYVVALHIGTLAAVAWVFRGEVAHLARTVLRWNDAPALDRRLVTLIAISTVPAAIAGIVLEGLVGEAFERPVLASFLLGVTGYFLMSSETVAERFGDETRDETTMQPRDAGFIGVAQATAILPGISRSGMTIGAGIRLGLSRRAATRFSFLMAIPIIFGAILVELPDMLGDGLGSVGPGSFLVGIVASGISGLFAVRWFLGVVERRGLRPFGTYCFLAMTAGMITALARG